MTEVDKEESRKRKKKKVYATMRKLCSVVEKKHG